MMTLVTDKELCKGCACVIPNKCVLKSIEERKVKISESRYADDEELREAIKSVISGCPLKAIELQTIGGLG